MPQGEDKEMLTGLEVGHNKHSVQGLGEQRSMAGTRVSAVSACTAPVL